ncbi:PTS sugar transporter subunit IIA [Gracilibacillus alcaliphilus]|uniref:PTS sugar transporter subunit IIA n=1 Tax=Gracilibacillus alcaliphilus TaxID=1401441 RepID=UPI001959086D|nr:PTS sugar transporter subunit IIA [Gracilibacillus alcaliphilus]MBM7677524.1 PTS system ascorbate-specific IIA component [Gracilibacillus alcaliphilus]
MKDLEKDHIAVQVEADDWKEAIQASGQLLARSGAVSEDYVNSMIQSVEKNGPYIVIAPGIAIAHARPSASVFENALALAILKEPVAFHSKENDPVDLVFSFSAKGDESHLKMIEQLSIFLMKEEAVKRLREVNSAEEAYQIITEGSVTNE